MNKELQKFDSLIEQPHVLKVGNDCWVVGEDPKHLLSIMIHGNEILGLHLINDLLENPPSVSFGLVLGNRQATMMNKRFFQRDLNRSFLEKGTSKLEERRAKEIESFARRFEYILDIHQTSNDAASEFFLCRHHKESLQMSQIFSDSPLVFLKESKMSSEGEGFGSFALAESLPFLTVELGKMGFDPEYFKKGQKVIQEFLTYKGENLQIDSERDAYIFSHKVIKENEDDHLIEGIINFQFLNQGLNMLKEREYRCPIDGYALFPKYGEYQKFSIDLCQILEKKKLKDVVDDHILK